MVTCNICCKNRELKFFSKTPFRYVCDECWEKIEIYIDEEKIDKDLMY